MLHSSSGMPVQLVPDFGVPLLAKNKRPHLSGSPELMGNLKKNWDRCYDFKSIFAEYFGHSIFCSNYCYFLHKYDHNIVFF
jgi:hypothetical protein